jgi:hypothetical protein
MQAVTTIGFESPNRFSRFMRWMRTAIDRSPTAEAPPGSAVFKKLRSCWLGSRPAPRHTISRVSSRRSSMLCA